MLALGSPHGSAPRFPYRPARLADRAARRLARRTACRRARPGGRRRPAGLRPRLDPPDVPAGTPARAWLDAGLRPVGAAPLPGGLARPAGLRGPAVRPGNGRAAGGAGSRSAVRAVFRAAGLLAGTWRRRGAGQRQLPCLPGVPHAGYRPAAPGRGDGVRASTPPDVAGALPRRSPADPSDAAAVLLRPAGLAHLAGGRGRARLAGATRLARP